jgi:hypothetical protein
MTACRFDLDHFRELIGAARTGGYRFARFDGEPQPGALYLRHDVDLDLDAALQLSAIERELGVEATYFLMPRSVFYNLASPEGERALQQLRTDGHAVGAHPTWPQLDIDARFDPLVSWHNPDPNYMSEPLVGAINVMAEPYVRNYRSDSNQHWRHGCPHEELERSGWEWLQLLIHPAIWVYPGLTMRETMLAMLDRERERRLAQLEQDRIDLS